MGGLAQETAPAPQTARITVGGIDNVIDGLRHEVDAVWRINDGTVAQRITDHQ
eukprot:SAG11_NODE_3771_length_2236_cov_2.717829_1_plen_53_part_00